MISAANKTQTDIAIFLPSLRIGGAERVAVVLANELATRTLSVDLVVVESNGDFTRDVSPAVRLVDLSASRTATSLMPLIRYLRARRPAAMLSLLSHTNVIAVVAIALARTGTRLVVSEHNAIATPGQSSKPALQTIVMAMIKVLYRRAYGIVAVSNTLAAELETYLRLGKGSVHAIYNPFDISTISRMSLVEPDLPWLHKNVKPLILGIGRLCPQKDFITLVMAFAKLRTRTPARLLILGDGEMRGAIENAAAICGLTADEFAMPGFVMNPYAFLSRCAVFVLSSRSEGLANVVIEALASGAAVVSTDCPHGPAEILEGGKWGRLVPIGDVDAMSDAMFSILNDSARPYTDGRQRALMFDKSISVDQYLSVLGFDGRKSKPN